MNTAMNTNNKPGALMTYPSFSVIICAYTEGRWHDLCAAIDSVRAQSVPALDIVVVVDHNAGLLDRLRAYAPDVIAIPNKGTQGLSEARNSGVAVARGDVIVFLDDDAAAAPDWLARLGAGYRDPCVLGVGGAILPRWRSERPRWLPREFYWVVGCTYRGMPPRAAQVRNLIGANMSFRREVFDAVDGFRNGIGRVGTHPLGCEETEFCIRVRQRWPHKALLYDPQATVHHVVPASRTRWSYFRARCYAEGLSKVRVARCVGTGDGLASERTYTLRTLPSGVALGMKDTLVGDPGGLLRAGAIMAGLTLATSGYIMGTATERLAGARRRLARVAYRARPA